MMLCCNVRRLYLHYVVAQYNNIVVEKIKNGNILKYEMVVTSSVYAATCTNLGIDPRRDEQVVTS